MFVIDLIKSIIRIRMVTVHFYHIATIFMLFYLSFYSFNLFVLNRSLKTLRRRLQMTRLQTCH